MNPLQNVSSASYYILMSTKTTTKIFRMFANAASFNV